MLIYGVCISDISYDAERIESFFESIRKTTASDIVEEYFLNKEENGCSLDDFLYKYEGQGGYYGLAACMKEIIEAIEGVNVSCDDPDGIHYLGLPAYAPWEYNEKTRNMSKEAYENMLLRYISCISSETPVIRWWNVAGEDS